MKKLLILPLLLFSLNNYSQSDRKDYLSNRTDIKDQNTKVETILKERVYVVFSESKKYFNFNFFDRKQGLIMSLHYTDYNDKIMAYKILPNEWGIENIIYDGYSITFEMTKPSPVLVMFLNLEKQ